MIVARKTRRLWYISWMFNVFVDRLWRMDNLPPHNTITRPCNAICFVHIRGGAASNERDRRQGQVWHDTLLVHVGISWIFKVIKEQHWPGKDMVVWIICLWRSSFRGLNWLGLASGARLWWGTYKGLFIESGIINPKNFQPRSGEVKMDNVVPKDHGSKAVSFAQLCDVQLCLWRTMMFSVVSDHWGKQCNGFVGPVSDVLPILWRMERRWSGVIWCIRIKISSVVYKIWADNQTVVRP